MYILGLGREKVDGYARLYFRYAADQGHIGAAMRLRKLDREAEKTGME